MQGTPAAPTGLCSSSSLFHGASLAVQYFTPLLEEGAKAQPEEGSRLSVLANLSSRTGSISENKFGGWYSYRASKAALNQCEWLVGKEENRCAQGFCNCDAIS